MARDTARSIEVVALVTAIIETRQRHLDGFMSRQTWRRHTRALVARAKQQNIEAEVLGFLAEVLV